MSERSRQFKSTTKSSSGDERKRSVFEPRPFAVQTKEAVESGSAEEVANSDLYEAYLRHQRLGLSFGRPASPGELPFVSNPVQPKLVLGSPMAGQVVEPVESVPQAKLRHARSPASSTLETPTPAATGTLQPRFAPVQFIEVAPGQEHHLPHEGGHAVQRMEGQVKSTMQARGVSINDRNPTMREPASRKAQVTSVEIYQRRAGETAPETSPPSSRAFAVDAGSGANFVAMPIAPPGTHSAAATPPTPAQLAQRGTNVEAVPDELTSETGIATPLLRSVERGDRSAKEGRPSVHVGAHLVPRTSTGKEPLNLLPPEGKSQTVANGVSQGSSADESFFKSEDNWPEASQRRELQDTINNSARVQRSVQVQELASNYSSRQQRLIQKKTDLDSPGKTIRSVANGVSAAAMNRSTLQRYVVAEDGLMSDNELMEVKHSGDLYATDVKIEEANARSPFEFTGDGSGANRKIVRVGAGVAPVGEDESFNIDEWRREAMGAVRQRVYQYVKNETENVLEDEDKMEAIGNKLGIENEANLKIELERKWDIWREDLLGDAMRRIDEYANDPRHRESRLVLTTDCGVMAGVVTGKVLDLNEREPDIFHLVKQGCGDETIVEWEHHVAATIMTDESDYVTMETAAAKTTDFFSKPSADKAWGFKMYGAKKGQSFEDQYKPLMSGGREFVDGEWEEPE